MRDPIKALTVQQPWAGAIAVGAKTTENRSTLWKHRGILAIHAGSRWSDRGGQSRLVNAAADRDPRSMDAWPPEFVVTGHVIALVVVEDAHRNAEGCCDDEWAEWSYREHKGGVRGDVVHLTLSDATRDEFDPIPCPGRLGLWDLPEEVAEQVYRQAEWYIWART